MSLASSASRCDHICLQSSAIRLSEEESQPFSILRWRSMDSCSLDFIVIGRQVFYTAEYGVIEQVNQAGWL